MKEVFKRLNNRILNLANTKWGVWALFLCSFADASVFGLPTPVLFLALALLNIKKAYGYALFGILGTLAGSVAGFNTKTH
jgi:membrane protein YqaA with SNARE-associated domain